MGGACGNRFFVSSIRSILDAFGEQWVLFVNLSIRSDTLSHSQLAANMETGIFLNFYCKHVRSEEKALNVLYLLTHRSFECFPLPILPAAPF